MKRFSTAALCALGVSLAACAAEPTPAPIVEAERAFAKDGYDFGVKASFLKHSADDAIVLSPGPVNAHESLAQQPDLDPNAPRQHLIWWPLWAGVAKSGDLGFTTGPFAIDDKPIGHYFTVWKKQADGGWKWVFDAGVGADPSAEAPQGSPAGYLPVARSGSASPETAQAEVDALETSIAAAAMTDLVAAYDGHLASDARVHTEGPPPAKGPDDYDSALAVRAKTMSFSYLGGGASSAGDMVWTYGDARWTADDGEKRGFYARMWQKRAEGWRIVFDELVPWRGPPE
jgi:ketosteroid isomerase-like protein